MRVIHKFPLKAFQEQPVRMPAGAKVLAAHAQRNVPAAAIISVVEDKGGTIVRLPGPDPREPTRVELADTMAMVAHKLGVPGGDLETGRIALAHEHAAMKAGLQTIARMVNEAASSPAAAPAVMQARETLERLGMGWW